MYRFSRSIYRELAPRVIEDGHDETGCRNRQAVLDSCESTIKRLMTDHRYFARPARTLFTEVRMHFAMSDQARVRQVIERNINLAIQLLETSPEVLDLGSEPRDCRAHTRKGTPCQREPLPGMDYCPSHKHLEETFEPAAVTFGDGDRELIAV